MPHRRDSVPVPRPSLVHWWIDQDQRTRRMATAGGALIAVVLVVCVVTAVPALVQPEPAPTAPPTLAPTATPRPTAVPTAQPLAVPPTPTPTLPPPPTETPSPPPSPTATLRGEPAEPPLPDPQGDVEFYDTGAPAGQYPAGVDIRAASVGPDLRVTFGSGQGVPQELAEWVIEGDVVLWIALHEPVPDPPVWNTEWLFALDLDGDPATGRPAGSARIDPDLGCEAALGVYYDPVAGEYVAYFLAWDPAQGLLLPTGATPRFTFDTSRTLVALSVPLETLARAGEIGAQARGRAAALSRVQAGTVIDFWPGLE